jgi:hypothetical protein
MWHAILKKGGPQVYLSTTSGIPSALLGQGFVVSGIMHGSSVALRTAGSTRAGRGVNFSLQLYSCTVRQFFKPGSPPGCGQGQQNPPGRPWQRSARLHGCAPHGCTPPRLRMAVCGTRFVRRNRKGRVLTVAREHYLRGACPPARPSIRYGRRPERV